MVQTRIMEIAYDGWITRLLSIAAVAALRAFNQSVRKVGGGGGAVYGRETFCLL